MAVSFFPGGNTPGGFYSFYHNILPNGTVRKIILKGGPGVGKSSLMRDTAAAWEARGFSVEKHYCSGDPDCLDAVAVQDKGLALLDGTAPHIVDPILPGAADGIFNLGRFLDESAMAEHRNRLTEADGELKECYRIAYARLAALKPFWEEASSIYEKALPLAVLQSLLGKIAASLPSRPGTGRDRRLFADAITWKGSLSLTDTLPGSRRIQWKVPKTGLVPSAAGLLGAVAREKGLDTISLVSPMSPDTVIHVWIPDGDLLFLSDETGDNTFPDYTSLASLPILTANRSRLEELEDLSDMLLHSAIRALGSAKAVHDRIETFYTPAMDFSAARSA